MTVDAPIAMKVKKTRKSGAASAPAEAAAPVFQPDRYVAGDFVVCALDGGSMGSLITVIRDGTAEVVTRTGLPLLISTNAITCRDDWSPLAPPRSGDLALLRYHPGKTFRVTGFDEHAAAFDLVDVADDSYRSMSPKGGMRILRRTRLADAYQDMGLPVPAHYAADVTPAPEALTTGWWRKSGPAHWIQEGRALCGREVPEGVVITTADPAAAEFQTNRCRKCAAAMAKAASMDEAPAAADQDLPFPVTEAQLTAALEAGGAPEQPAASEELPGTPVLLPPAEDLEPAVTPTPEVTPLLQGADVRTIALSALHPSPLNPRKVFDSGKLAELSESIAHQGLMQNLVIRPNTGEGGGYEVVAGGRRLRALQLLAEQGRITGQYMVPVRIRQDLTDLQALMLAVAENQDRADVSPLEEADAYAQMVHLGATVHDIALRYGRTERHVHQRLTLARDLGDDGRALLDAGTIGLGQAQVIAQTAGPLRKHVVKAAERGDSVKALNHMIVQQSILVEHAKFDVPGSGLEIIEDLYGSAPARFADPKTALARQLDWVEQRRATLASKKEQYFVEILKTDSTYLHLPYSDYTEYNPPKELRGTVILVSTVTGEVQEKRCARQKDVNAHQAKQRAADKKAATEDATGTAGAAIRKGAYVHGHQARAAALRTALIGDHKRTVALGIMALLGTHLSNLSVNTDGLHLADAPRVKARLLELDAKLDGALDIEQAWRRTQGFRVGTGWKGSYGGGKQDYAFLQQLLDLTLEELLDLHGILIAESYGGWNEYRPEEPISPFLQQLAADVGAKVEFELTAEHLKAYPRERLLELARDAKIGEGPDGRGASLEGLATNKLIIAEILAHAPALQARGYVPPVARFPQGKGKKGKADR